MEERPQEESTQRTGLSSLIARLYQPGPLIILFTVAFLALVGLGVYLLNADTPPPPVVSQIVEAEPVAKDYEEDSSSEMEDKVKQADLAIIETMKTMGMSMADLGLLDVEMRRLNGKGYHYQVLQLPASEDHALFQKNLLAALAKRLPEAKLTAEKGDELALFIDDMPTHRLLLESMQLTLPKPESKGPKMAVVIDDIGENMPVLKGLLAIDAPLTFAVWPNATHTRDSVGLITERKRDLIIHFPMEPRGYPQYNPGDDALFVSMTREQIEQRVEENVSRIPEAIGVNNHMGSRFTADGPGMTTALAAFKRHGLFFLDSLTTGKSAARASAKETGIPFYERDIFIDNVKDVSAIIHQLKKAENVSLKQGYSIAIGHPYKETLAALEKWTASRNGAIVLIPLSQLQPQ